MKQSKKHMKRFSINTQPIILVLFGLGFLSVILAATMMASAQTMSNQGSSSNSDQNHAQITQAPVTDDTILAVVREVDTDNQLITLFDVSRQMSLYLSYTGETNVTDKYGKLISISQITPGDMVDAAYDSDFNKLLRMNISTKAWEYNDVNNLTIDLKKQVIKLVSTKYKYNQNLFILNGKDLVTVDNLTSQDVLTIWGYQETIWSITVTKGHGTVKLENYKDYLGDMISIGYESMLQITNNFSVPVREGTYNLTVENGQYSATKSVTVKRNKVVYVSLSDIGPVGPKRSQVTFQITPNGADLYIDGKLTTYDEPVTLNYGNHSAVASLGGYSSYKGTVNIGSETETIKINLPEEASDKDAVATKTDASGKSSNISNTTTSGTSGNNTGSSTSGGNTSDSTTDQSADNSSDNSSDSSADGVKYSQGTTDYTLADGDSVDQSHQIYIKAPSGASVYLDSEYMGKVPCKFDKIVGSHVLTFIKDGYKTVSYTVDVENDKKDAYFTFPDLTKSKSK